jgi:predicted GIY-YIG superfamily endonuclease
MEGTVPFKFKGDVPTSILGLVRNHDGVWPVFRYRRWAYIIDPNARKDFDYANNSTITTDDFRTSILTEVPDGWILVEKGAENSNIMAAIKKCKLGDIMNLYSLGEDLNPGMAHLLQQTLHFYSKVPDKYLYLLKTSDELHSYCGITANLKRRITEHNKGNTAATSEHMGKWTVHCYTIIHDDEILREMERLVKEELLEENMRLKSSVTHAENTNVPLSMRIMHYEKIVKSYQYEKHMHLWDDSFMYRIFEEDLFCSIPIEGYPVRIPKPRTPVVKNAHQGAQRKATHGD